MDTFKFAYNNQINFHAECYNLHFIHCNKDVSSVSNFTNLEEINNIQFVYYFCYYLYIYLKFISNSNIQCDKKLLQKIIEKYKMINKYFSIYNFLPLYGDDEIKYYNNLSFYIRKINNHIR
jgi:hypothetical protein